jgi:SNF2 family DNA or RNA helicase
MKLPESFTPHKYQLEAIKHTVLHPHGGLFIKPGLGKTASILAAFKILKNNGYVKAMLIVAPLRVATFVWRQEVDKWLEFEQFKCALLHGKDKDALLDKKADIYIINYEGLLWLLPKLTKLKIWPFDWVVFDESSKMKAYNSKRFKALKKLLPKFKRRTILTGTPMPNSYMDLFSLSYIMDCGEALTPYITHFRNEFFYLDINQHKPGEPPDSWAYKLNPGGDIKIQDRIAHLIYTSKGDEFTVDQTPVFNDVYIDLPEKVRKQYKSMERILMAQVTDKTILAANAGVASGKCRQIVNGAMYIDAQGNYEVLHDEKLDALDDLLEELSGDPVLIWFEFKSDLARLLERFPGEVMTAKSPPDIVERWNAKKIPIMYVHHQSAGHGLNLQFGGNTMIWFSLCWSGEDYEQAVARLARQGQKNRVIVHRILARNTIDVAIVTALKIKGANQDDFLAALRDYNLELGTEALLNGS